MWYNQLSLKIMEACPFPWLSSIYDTSVVQQEVKVNSPWAIAYGGDATNYGFDTFQENQEILGFKICLNLEVVAIQGHT